MNIHFKIFMFYEVVSVGPSVRNPFFVRGGTLSVADYNSTRMGVGVVVVVVVVNLSMG